MAEVTEEYDNPLLDEELKTIPFQCKERHKTKLLNTLNIIKMSMAIIGAVVAVGSTVYGLAESSNQKEGQDTNRKRWTGQSQ